MFAHLRGRLYSSYLHPTTKLPPPFPSSSKHSHDSCFLKGPSSDILLATASLTLSNAHSLPVLIEAPGDKASYFIVSWTPSPCCTQPRHSVCFRGDAQRRWSVWKFSACFCHSHCELEVCNALKPARAERANLKSLFN